MAAAAAATVVSSRQSMTVLSMVCSPWKKADAAAAAVEVKDS